MTGWLDELPLQTLEKTFQQALAEGPVVLSAPTGSGKSTLAPWWCAQQGHRTLVVEPRRVACRALYRFLATHSSQRVGYSVRHEQENPDAAVLFVTPGVAARLHADSGLVQFDVVVVDEFHERRMDVDLLLALLREQRSRLGLVVMSATLDLERIATWLDATCVQGDARSHPVERHHLGDVEIPTTRGLTDRVVAGVDQALSMTDQGDVLVFLPGKGEIRDAERALQGRRGTPVLPLHASLPRREQDRVFEPSSQRRVILATNVAESSVTIPGVRAVVDSGLERRTSYRRARSVLALSPISNQSAIQRAGRAGRVAPGVAIRLWSARGILRPDTPPEILREDLDPLLLMAGALDRTPDRIQFLDPPAADAVQAATGRLARLGLLDPDGALTPLGRRAAKLPVDPQLARILIEAERSGDPRLQGDAVDLVATLAVSGPLVGRPPGRRVAPSRDRRGRALPPAPDPGPPDPDRPICDATLRIKVLRGEPAGNLPVRTYARREAQRIARQLRQRLRLPRSVAPGEVRREDLAALVLRADPGAAFVLRRARFAGEGIEVTLGADSVVSPESEALVVLDIRSQRQRGLRAAHQATCAIPVTRRWLASQGVGAEVVGAARLKKHRLIGKVRRELAGVALAEREMPLEGELAVAAAARLAKEQRLFRSIHQTLVERLQQTAAWFAHRREPPPAPLDLEPWLTHRFAQLGLTKGADLDLLSPEDLLPTLVDADELDAFARLFPVRVVLPDRKCDAEYDFSARVVELVHRSGNQRQPPAPSMLPRGWTGFKVVYRVHSRRYEIR